MTALLSDKLAFIEKVFGRAKVSKTNVAISCPFCKNSDSSKKKLSIRLIDDLNHCWVCGWSARNLIPLILKCGSRDNFDEYKKKYLIDDGHSHKQREIENEIVQLPSGFKLLYGEQVSRNPDILAVMNYLRKRGIAERDLAYFALGVSDQYEYRRRVIIPSFDKDGKLNYLVARAIDDANRIRYLNSITPKTSIIFNELKIDWTKRIVLVEGPFDLMKCPENSTCMLGSALTEEHYLFVKLIEHSCDVVMCLDNDATAKANKIANNLKSYGVNVRMCSLPEDKDPGQLSKDQMAEIVEKSVEWNDMSSFLSKIKLLNSHSLAL